jgi:hypothetical protein
MTKPASASISSNLANSDGWNVKKGSSIHRFDPRVALPRTNTSAMLAMMKV